MGAFRDNQHTTLPCLCFALNSTLSPPIPPPVPGNTAHQGNETPADVIAHLRASARRLEAVIHAAQDAIVCVDHHQRIVVFNPVAAVLFQCPERDALGTSPYRFIPSFQQVLTFSQLTTRADLGEIPMRTASGHEMMVEANVSFTHHAEGITTTLFARDVSGRKRAEARRAELEAHMRESQKIQAMGTLAGGIAHDFNNILHAILGNIELAKTRCSRKNALWESLQEIEKAGLRARELVRQILTFSRNDAPQLTAVALADVACETEQLLRVNLPPYITLSINLPSDLPLVLADVTQAQQALLNLCTNAIQAINSQYPTDGLQRIMRKGLVCGLIRIEAAVTQPDWPLRERLELANGTYVALTVEDDGPGMNDSVVARIFEPFFTTKPKGHGTGLGLPVVHGIMRTHSGAIDVHSTPGVGSRLTLYFPVAPEDAQLPPVAIEAPCPTPKNPGRPHILYIDDDEALVLLAQRLWQKRGYRISGFTDPHQALDTLRTQPTEYDLLVTDYNMPGYSGLDVLREALSIRDDLPVALTSGYVTPDIEQAALAAGARALIHKPDDVQKLCATVDRLIHPSTKESP